MRNHVTQGALVAAMAAGLFAAAPAAPAHAGDSDKVHCKGINACKGKGACHSAGANACAGKNECKGKGWIVTSEKECKEKGGKVEKADKAAMH